MQQSIELLYPDDSDWQQLCQQLRSAVTLATLVLTAWKMGLWIARSIVEQQLTERESVKMSKVIAQFATLCY